MMMSDIYYILKSPYLKPCVAYPDLCTYYVLLVPIFHAEAKEDYFMFNPVSH